MQDCRKFKKKTLKTQRFRAQTAMFFVATDMLAETARRIASRRGRTASAPAPACCARKFGAHARPAAGGYEHSRFGQRFDEQHVLNRWVQRSAGSKALRPVSAGALGHCLAQHPAQAVTASRELHRPGIGQKLALARHRRFQHATCQPAGRAAGHYGKARNSEKGSATAVSGLAQTLAELEDQL